MYFHSNSCLMNSRSGATNTIRPTGHSFLELQATKNSIYSKTSVWCWRKTGFTVSSLATLFLYRDVLLDPNCENKSKINSLPEPRLRVRPSLSWLTNAVTNDLMISKYCQTFLCETPITIKFQCFYAIFRTKISKLCI